LARLREQKNQTHNFIFFTFACCAVGSVGDCVSAGWLGFLMSQATSSTHANAIAIEIAASIEFLGGKLECSGILPIFFYTSSLRCDVG
jgi:putative flippase GtrA